MKGIIVAASLFCVALIGLGVFFATRTTSSSARIVPINQQYTNRVNAGGWVTGAENAEVSVVEYGDFQCPGCAALKPVIEEAMNQTNSFASFTFKHYPLAQHNKARLAAQGAEAAGRQGKFWEMHRVLYGTQQNWENDSVSAFRDYLIENAKAFNIDVEQFKNDLNDTTITDQINKDATEGNKLPVTATPTLVINGKKIYSIPSTAEGLVSLIQSYRTAPSATPQQ
jgi:protein-disulfide isomerase